MKSNTARKLEVDTEDLSTALRASKQQRLLKKEERPQRKTASKPVLLTPDEANDIIVEHRDHGIRLAWSFLKSWRIKLNNDDVMSIVHVALCEAAKRFDKSREVTFKTFFFYHLRGLLLKEITRMIKDKKIYEEVAVPQQATTRPLDRISFAAWPFPIIENKTPESIAQQHQAADLCRLATSQLDELEREVISRFFVDEQPLKSIAEELGYCRCHISRVKSQALQKLHRTLAPSAAAHLEGEQQELERPSGKRSRYTGGRGRRKPSEVRKRSSRKRLKTA